MKLRFFFFSILFSNTLLGQCPTCGNGVVDAGENNVNCPQDVPHAATATSPCAAPGSYEGVSGIRVSHDFTGTSTWSTTGLPAGWSFAGAPSATTAGVLPAADIYGAKAGLIQPNCSGGCASTNGFCIGNMANSVVAGSKKLGADFDGRTNVTQNLSYAVLRGQGNPTLVSETFNLSGVESFKIQIWLNASETSCGQSNAWGSCVGNAAYLDFSSNGGTSWTQVLTLNNSSTNSDMSTFSGKTNNTFYIQEGTWSRLCLTVFKTTNSPGNFYSENNSTLTAPTGIMTNNAYFTNAFKFRIRYSQTASCTSGISATNPGRYLAIDYPVITSGNQCIPCGISFINMAGYGADNNDDGVGSSTLTTTSTAFSTVKRSVNQAERGVEIFNSQNSTFGSQNLSGSNFTTNYDLCNPEGGDQQCIDWTNNTNNYFVVYECITDFSPTSGSVNVQYYKGSAAQSFGLTKITTAGKTAALGWRWSGNRFVSCSSLSDLNAGCNGYSFTTSSLPNQFVRAFYGLSTTQFGNSYSYYGPNSNSHYFNGPTFAPIVVPTPGNAGSFLACSGHNTVFSGINDYCNTGGGQLSAGTLTVTGPNGFNETFNSGSMGSTNVIDPGDYVISPTIGSGPTQCLDCGRPICISITQSDIDNIACITLNVELNQFYSNCIENSIQLHWSTSNEKNNDFFILEYSEDGKQFQYEATIDGHGTTSELSHYSYQTSSSKNGYYRLLQYDFDGRINILKTIDVNCAQQKRLVVFPNPTQQNLQILMKDVIKDGNASLQLINMQGSILMNKPLTKQVMDLNLDGIERGTYLLKVTIDENVYLEKIIKQ